MTDTEELCILAVLGAGKAQCIYLTRNRSYFIRKSGFFRICVNNILSAKLL